MSEEVLISSTLEALSEEVTKMPVENYENVTEVGRQQNIIRGILLFHAFDGMRSVVSGGKAVGLVCAVPELGMNRREDLFGRGRNLWIRKAVVIVVKQFMKDRVF